MDQKRKIDRLFISPPFGNWYNPLYGHVVPIRGSYTVKPRGFKYWYILKTLRPVKWRDWSQGWFNRIGLRNKGMYNIKFVVGETYSFAPFSCNDIRSISDWLYRYKEHINVELNISCPSVEIYQSISELVHSDYFETMVDRFPHITIKLNPNTPDDIIEHLYCLGVRRFHCGNTLATGGGSLSGPHLKPHNLNMVMRVRDLCPDSYIIGGGGIYNYQDACDFVDAGANALSLSSIMFKPIRARRLINKIVHSMC